MAATPKSRRHIAFVAACLQVLGACLVIAPPARAEDDYGFQFDLTKDDQHAVVLDYRYSAGSKTLIGADREYAKSEKGYYGENVVGPMPRGTVLYVKWRDTFTNEVSEDTVDLDKLLPRDLDDKTIFLMIRGRQLQIFLIATTTPRESGTPVIGPSMWGRWAAIQIYPPSSATKTN
jgi:hypothetical protein